jgi:hypothetical protein
MPGQRRPEKPVCYVPLSVGYVRWWRLQLNLLEGNANYAIDELSIFAVWQRFSANRKLIAFQVTT